MVGYITLNILFTIIIISKRNYLNDKQEKGQLHAAELSFSTSNPRLQTTLERYFVQYIQTEYYIVRSHRFSVAFHLQKSLFAIDTHYGCKPEAHQRRQSHIEREKGNTNIMRLEKKYGKSVIYKHGDAIFYGYRRDDGECLNALPQMEYTDRKCNINSVKTYDII